MIPSPPTSTLFPYTTLFRSRLPRIDDYGSIKQVTTAKVLLRVKPSRTPDETFFFVPGHCMKLKVSSGVLLGLTRRDRKSTRLNSSHEWISNAVFCLKKKKKN